MEKSNNYNAIDLFKLIMAICVVAIHTNPYIAVDNKALLVYTIRVVGVRKPFFFLSSGFLIGKKYFGGANQHLYFAASKKTI